MAFGYFDFAFCILHFAFLERGIVEWDHRSIDSIYTP